MDGEGHVRISIVDERGKQMQGCVCLSCVFFKRFLNVLN